VSWRLISPEIRSSKEVKNYNTKSNELTYKAKVYSNIRLDNSYILAKPNKTIKTSETNNKPAAIEESINYIITTLKVPGIVTIKAKGKD
jgi:hypothetical protein